VFNVAFYTLFLVTAGEPWPEALPRRLEDGSSNWAVALFTTCYTIVTIWLVLQVSFTVLLDNYIDASARLHAQERLEGAEAQHREQHARNPLEPLLFQFAQEFTDDEDLSDRLRRLYQVLSQPPLLCTCRRRLGLVG
jgi:hypothetical protein